MVDLYYCPDLAILLNLDTGKMANYLEYSVASAVTSYWNSRLLQSKKQSLTGKIDQGARSAVTGGAHMDGFIRFFTQVIIQTGLNPQHIYYKTALELPGYFRPTKEWDLLVVKNGVLIAAIETKSQAGPSFGNNFNNRTEEAMGSALDLWTAFREGALGSSAPFLGYFFLLEDCPASRSPVRTRQPHFSVFPEFVNSSYAKRYEIFCRKLVRERHYTASAFITSERETGLNGIYNEPDPILAVAAFTRSLVAHVAAFVDG